MSEIRKSYLVKLKVRNLYIYIKGFVKCKQLCCYYYNYFKDGKMFLCWEKMLNFDFVMFN